MLSGRFTETRPLHPRNAPLPIDFTLFGIFTEVIVGQLSKQLIFIESTE